MVNIKNTLKTCNVSLVNIFTTTDQKALIVELKVPRRTPRHLPPGLMPWGCAKGQNVRKIDFLILFHETNLVR